MDSINWISYYLNKCQTLSNTLQMTFFFQEDSALVHTCIVRARQSTAAALSTSFILNHAPNSPELNAFDYKI